MSTALVIAALLGRALASGGGDLDIILYGATGCVGGIAAKHFAKQPGLRWAVAGRNSAEVDQLAKTLCADPDVQSCPEQIVAPLDADAGSWVKRAKVVATAAGPFSAHDGEFLVQACAQLGVHYVDTSDEFYWQRAMIDKYDAGARATGARIVLSGGFCALAADLGAQLAIAGLGQQASSDGAVVEVDSWLETYNGGLSAGVINTGKAMQNASYPKEWNDDPYVLAPNAATDLRVDTSVTNVKAFDYDQHEGAVTENIFGPYDARLLRRTFVERSQVVHYRAGATPSMYTKWSSFIALHPGSWSSLATCPTQKVLDDGSWQVRVRAQAASASKTVLLSGSGDPGYQFTATSMAEVALCLSGKTPACLRAEGSGGVQTTMLALAPSAVQARWHDVGLLQVQADNSAAQQSLDTIVV